MNEFFNRDLLYYLKRRPVAWAYWARVYWRGLFAIGLIFMAGWMLG